MQRDVFYYGIKPNAHPKEQHAQSLSHARELATSEHFWIINEFCDYTNFDWEWGFEFLPEEDLWAEDHNNAWPSINNMDSGTWLCPKKHSELVVHRVDVEPLKLRNFWHIYEKVKNVEELISTWAPDPYDPPYIYTWGNRYVPGEVKPTIEYRVPGATDRKYVSNNIELLPNLDNWRIFENVDFTKFDLFWTPGKYEPPYIYTWGNKYTPGEEKPTIEYHEPGATDRKYMGIVDLEPEWDKWIELIPVDKNTFDFSWRPSPYEPPMIYVFGNKWNDSKTEPTLEYHVPGAEIRKYMDYPVATTKIDMQYWTVSNTDDLKTFDFSWRPNPFSPPQIYQWANNGPRYTVPSATEVVLMEYEDSNMTRTVNRYNITTTLEDLINEHIDEVFWVTNPDLKYDTFDFNWKPSSENFRHINVFGNEQSKDTQTYYVNGPMYKLGYRQYNYIEDTTVTIESTLDMFYIERNGRGKDRFELLKQRYPNLQKTRYLNSWVDTINRCCNKSKTKLCWILNSEIDYSDFNFDFYPNLWQIEMVHVFGTQWSHWGNTYLVNSEVFEEKTKHVKVIEHLNIINFVKTKRTKAVEKLYETVLIDHGNNHNMEAEYTILYEDSYLNTFKKMLDILPVMRDHYVWVCSSICDYSNFDFTYICDPYSSEQLHVFPSNNQKFGDTFLINVNKLRVLLTQMKTLADYEKVNYNQHQRVNRLPAPVINVTDDTHCNSLDVDYDFPYAIFQTENITLTDNEPLNLWEPESKIIKILSEGATQIIVPKEAKAYVKKELYDYPYIKKADRLTKSNPLDIVFFSNGEAIADKNYEHLLQLTKNLPNRVIRIDGVNGRVKSQHAAANSSNTPWYFLVNAKLKVDSKFDFNWQPDRLQIPKHYIFHATNPVNGLIYGHQAIVANNKKLTLENYGTGLDFTMDSEHEVIAINSGIGMYNASEWDTWRTSFRECIKLRASGTEENAERLDAWLSIGIGEFAEYSINGAKDAMEYYDSVNGDFDKLRLSYDWDWLHTYYQNQP